MTGVLVIDKPVGPTSHDIVMMVKRILSARKVGHIGTLDPIASGVLPLCINDATRLARFLENGEKEYLAVIKLGEETDTYDSAGSVVAKCDTASLNKENIAAVIDGFKGKIKQMPPMFSAVKMNGISLYKLARLGVEVERRPRDIEIYSICVNDITIPFVTVSVVCSKGTYIRSLAFDIGRKLGCGAHIVSLRRIKSGRFSLKESITIDSLKNFKEDIAEKNIISIERIFADIYDIEVDTTSAGRIMDGIAPIPTLLAGKAARPSSAALSKGIDFSSSIRDDEMVSFTSNRKIIALARYKGRGGFKLERVFK
ncbi:MAG: tRNA pseudouridine(55) synthase TruB [Deltaproteobacteria bacterium]|nr:tRNA pseudouridine(55) synthase TruB [Deltaproteobacteria bacterium]